MISKIQPIKLLHNKTRRNTSRPLLTSKLGVLLVGTLYNARMSKNNAKTDSIATTPASAAVNHPRTGSRKNMEWKGNPKQRRFMALWTNPKSPTFGNITQSGIQAGFKPTYARNMVAIAPRWLSENIEVLRLEQEHIVQGVQELAINAPNSKSPDDTRLKAYEVLAKIAGLLDKQPTTTVNIVQPILGGASVTDIDTTIS